MLRDLQSADLVVLRDLVRFGILTGDQIERRFQDFSLGPDRLESLISGGYIEQWSPLIKDTSVFSATGLGAHAARCGLRATRPSLEHLRHDIAVVDLADYLLREDGEARWVTEREVGRVLRASSPQTRARGFRKGYSHRPDGLLLTDDRRLAIELEHRDKGDLRYAQISRWFALTSAIDAVRWYVDDDKIIARLRRVCAEHGFTDDVDFTYAAFPPGVVIRPWVRS